MAVVIERSLTQSLIRRLGGPVPAAHADRPEEPPERVPVGELIHNSRRVLGLVEAGHRVQITRHGRVVAVIGPPDQDEIKLDELAAGGHVPADWRDRQRRLRDRLRTIPARSQPPGEPTGSASIIADRDRHR
ncbi:type II toxin-antitoxin system Phd/YefM family antitoxin [Gandjariella thermophila]|uniref:Antitoxin n=1 Tax=Gandjariella thermophila TaxID=1931992 RepID=A0A4D4J081_9PSEU|nr:hypothetical protein [Gandjariella thermophila]GDY30015.1 hypothetical protein GTS_16480 [Gandjariella thermophila]